MKVDMNQQRTASPANSTISNITDSIRVHGKGVEQSQKISCKIQSLFKIRNYGLCQDKF